MREVTWQLKVNLFQVSALRPLKHFKNVLLDLFKMAFLLLQVSEKNRTSRQSFKCIKEHEETQEEW